jgi:hypothetical protein
VADGQTKVQTRIQSRVLARVASAVPVLPPRLAVIEIVILLMLPAVLEWQWPQFPALTTFQPHPYWAAVLLLSLQYGTVSGLLAAAVAIVATAIIGLPEPDIGENHFAYLVRIWTQPVLWISAALLLGHFRMRQIEQRNELNRTVEELESRSKALTGHSEGLAARCDALERRLAVRTKADAGALLNALAEMPVAAGTGRWAAAFDAAVQAAFPGAAATLYTSDGADAKSIARSGASVQRASSRLSSRDALVMAMSQGRALSATSGRDDEALAGHGPFAVPMQRHDGTVLTFLLVESIPASLVDHSTVKRLQAFVASIGMPVSAAQTAAAGAPPPLTVAEAPALASSDTALSIPVIPKWRQLRWLPASLRAAEPTREEPDDAPAPLQRSTSSVSR